MASTLSFANLIGFSFAARFMMKVQFRSTAWKALRSKGIALAMSGESKTGLRYWCSRCTCESRRKTSLTSLSLDTHQEFCASKCSRYAELSTPCMMLSCSSSSANTSSRLRTTLRPPPVWCVSTCRFSASQSCRIFSSAFSMAYSRLAFSEISATCAMCGCSILRTSSSVSSAGPPPPSAASAPSLESDTRIRFVRLPRSSQWRERMPGSRSSSTSGTSFRKLRMSFSASCASSPISLRRSRWKVRKTRSMTALQFSTKVSSSVASIVWKRCSAHARSLRSQSDAVIQKSAYGASVCCSCFTIE